MTSAQIDISVVIPAFNAAQTIGRQLESLALQKWCGTWEVIVVDNGSTDATVASVLEWDVRLPKLSIVDASRKRGPSFARNMGARCSGGRFLLFVDADDEVGVNWLATMAEAFENADFITGSLLPMSEAGPSVDALAGIGRPTRFSKILASKGFLDAAPSGNLGIRKSIWDQVGGFREDMIAGEDTAFSWDVQLAGYTLVHVPNATVRYTMRSTTRELARQQFRWGVAAAQLYAVFRAKGAPRPSIPGALARWGALIATAPIALATDRRRDWIGRISRRAGSLVGSMRFRVISL